jgi:cytochrome c2
MIIRTLALLAGAALLAAPVAATADEAPAAFKKNCVQCHIVGKNSIGPNLVGAYGRKIGKADAFKYSDAHLKFADQTINDEFLTKYLANPKETIPGNRMIFVGLKNPDDVKEVIGYLKSLK